jgi:hypothetical protein
MDTLWGVQPLHKCSPLWKVVKGPPAPASAVARGACGSRRTLVGACVRARCAQVRGLKMSEADKKRQQQKHEAIIAELLKQPENRTCADCGEKGAPPTADAWPPHTLPFFIATV